MSRRKKADKRIINPDPKYANLLVSKFMNYLMVDGKRTVASGIMYDALDTVKSKTKKDELEQFLEIVDKVKPSLEVRSRRVGGATYQVPIEIRAERRQALGLRWLVRYARLRNEKTMSDKLANEIIDATNSMGGAFKKKEDTHKMAEANKAFAHYRW